METVRGRVSCSARSHLRRRVVVVAREAVQHSALLGRAHEPQLVVLAVDGDQAAANLSRGDGSPAHASSDAAKPSYWSEILALFHAPHAAQTAVVVAYGLAWGIVNWGFIAFLPFLWLDTEQSEGEVFWLDARGLE